MALPIRQNLDVLAGLNRTQRAVLTLVVELAENGGKGYCDATNDYLCKRTQATARTVTRTLSELQRLGLLASGGHTTRRQITATALLRPCYTSATKEACFAATISLGEVLSIDKMAIDEPRMSIDKQGAAIDKPSQCLETNEALSIDILGTPYKETSKDEYLDEQNEKREALALAQKKIEQQATELAEASEDLAKCRATIAALRAENEKQAKELAAAGRTQQRSELPFDSPEFAAAWRDLQAAQGFAPGSARERAKVAQLLAVASSEHEAIQAIVATIAGNWTKFYTPDEPRPQHFAQNGVAGYGQRTAPAVHANPFGRAAAESIAIARAVVVGSAGDYPGLI